MTAMIREKLYILSDNSYVILFPIDAVSEIFCLCVTVNSAIKYSSLLIFFRL